MKHLLLIRHAKSSWKDASLLDFERPLNKRGKNDAPAMAAYLKHLGQPIDHLVASPAKRARNTAQCFANTLGIPASAFKLNAHLYEATAEGILRVVGETPDHISSLAICGHNPGLNQLAALLLPNSPDNIPTCGILCISVSGRDWNDLRQRESRLNFFIYPKALPDASYLA